jgi:hypothetical protein
VSSLHVPTDTLRFLSIVDTARIPLYLAAGPSLDVWTTLEHTQEWFHSIIAEKTATSSDSSNTSSKQWWNLARSQSPTGILVQVENDAPPGTHPRITEILFYGTVLPTPQGLLPTPPSSISSSPKTDDDQIPELRIYALPLSSDLLPHSQLSETPTQPISPNTTPTKINSQFLSSRLSPAAKCTQSPKRKRDVFEEAAQARKMARRKGGESVAAAAAKIESTSSLHRKSLSIDIKGLPSPGLKRPSTAGSYAGAPSQPQSPNVSHDVRPLSRKGLDGPGKRSSLSRVESVPLAPEEPTIESRNKEALSRVVMAAMRMYGLQQRKKTNRSRRPSVAPGRVMDVSDKAIEDEVSAEDAAKDEEFKLIYHQTFKGAALALVSSFGWLHFRFRLTEA